MEQQPNKKIKLVIAGPGAGKTTNLVKEIIVQLPNLSPHRFMVVITYTNAATENIHKELRKSISIPDNLFIGTIHNFLNRFILIPYSNIYNITPNDLKFIDDIEIKNSKYRNAVIKKARDGGVITFSQIEWISEKLINNGKVGLIKVKSKELNDILGMRIQMLFVDEYQDASITQKKILEKLIQNEHMEFGYFVGDPEQYIYGFTYAKSPVPKPEFADIPINKLEDLSIVSKEVNDNNYRSTSSIVTFLNCFSKIIQTCNNKGDCDPVFFISSIDIEELIKKFDELCQNSDLKIESRFYLSQEGKFFDTSSIAKWNKIDNTSLRSNKVLSETLRCISGLLGKSQKQIMQENNLTIIEWRHLGIELLQKISNMAVCTQKEVIEILKTTLNLEFVDKDFQLNGENTIKLIKQSRHVSSKDESFISTIHKSKGLQADAVLVIAKNLDELKKWIECNRDERLKDKNDTCRIGFVGFSRAKKLLVICCLEKMTLEVKNKLTELDVKIIEDLQKESVINSNTPQLALF